MVPKLDSTALSRLYNDSRKIDSPAFLLMPLLSAAIAARDEAAIRLIIEASLDSKIRRLVIDEVILQSHLFLGFPAMIEASRLLALIKPAPRKSSSLPQAYSPDDCLAWHNAGMVKIRKLYGSKFEQLVPYINSFSPQILTWMVNEGYGKVLSRRGIAFKLRELCIVATLTVTGYENQLMAHSRGAINTGIKPELVKRTIRNCKYFCPECNIRQALEILNRVGC